MKNFILLSSLFVLTGTQHVSASDLLNKIKTAFRWDLTTNNTSETPPSKSTWQKFTLVSAEPWNKDEKHTITLTEGPADPASDPTRIFRAEITKESPRGNVTRDDTIFQSLEAPLSTTQPSCNPATCFFQCICKPKTQQTVEPSLIKKVRQLHKKGQSTCQGLCILNESCTCGTASARYNKSHPHIQLGSTNVNADGSLSTDIDINMEACSIDKDCTSPWIHILCDQNTKLYQFFRIKQILATSGKDVTKKLEKNYAERRFGSEWMERFYGKNWKDN